MEGREKGNVTREGMMQLLGEYRLTLGCGCPGVLLVIGSEDSCHCVARV